MLIVIPLDRERRGRGRVWRVDGASRSNASARIWWERNDVGHRASEVVNVRVRRLGLVRGRRMVAVPRPALHGTSVRLVGRRTAGVSDLRGVRDDVCDELRDDRLPPATCLERVEPARVVHQNRAVVRELLVRIPP